MRFASLEHFGLSAWRMACLGLVFSSGAWLTANVALGGVLGDAKPLLLLVVSALVFYLVASFPRRMLDSQRVTEASEAVLLSASAKACLSVTGSRPKTLMTLKPREGAIARSLREAARLVLLGVNVEEALREGSRELVSYSARTTLGSLATLRPEGFDAGDEEASGLASSNELSKETKLPVFMTVCFFTPMMATLYAVFSHSYGQVSMAELTALELIIVDLAYYLTSFERGKG